MSLVENNIEMLCKKNHISRKDLFEKLEINEEILSSKSRSKTVMHEKERFFQKIADYFMVTVDELQNRFWDEPAIVWKLNSNKEEFFSELLNDTRKGNVCWSLLNDIKAFDAVCAKSKYFNSNVMFSYVAYEYRTEEYVAIMYSYTEHMIKVNMNSIRVEDESLRTKPVVMRIEIPGHKNQEFSGDYIYKEYINPIFEMVSTKEDMVDSEKWYQNPDYESSFELNYCTEFTIGIDFWGKGIRPKVKDTTQRVKRREEAWIAINNLIEHLKDMGHVSDKELEELRRELTQNVRR